MSLRGENARKILFLAASAFVVFEMTSAWPHYYSFHCGANQHKTRSANKGDLVEQCCGLDRMNANTRKPSGCRTRCGMACVCNRGYFRKKPHGSCTACVRPDMCN
uniref:Uncharacterized protein n=1 Tax=Rhipicephalus pulchellus TaxID=72859 RepID=L7LVT4_RHIPC